MARHQPLPARYGTNFAGVHIQLGGITGRIIGRIDHSFNACKPAWVKVGTVLVRWDSGSFSWVEPNKLKTLTGDSLL